MLDSPFRSTRDPVDDDARVPNFSGVRLEKDAQFAVRDARGDLIDEDGTHLALLLRNPAKATVARV